MKVLLAKLIKFVEVNRNTCGHDGSFKKIISSINMSNEVHSLKRRNYFHVSTTSPKKKGRHDNKLQLSP